MILGAQNLFAWSSGAGWQKDITVLFIFLKDRAMFYFGLVFAVVIHSELLHPVLACTDGILGAKCCLVAFNGFFMAIKIYFLHDYLNTRGEKSAL